MVNSKQGLEHRLDEPHSLSRRTFLASTSAVLGLGVFSTGRAYADPDPEPKSKAEASIGQSGVRIETGRESDFYFVDPVKVTDAHKDIAPRRGLWRYGRETKQEDSPLIEDKGSYVDVPVTRSPHRIPEYTSMMHYSLEVDEDAVISFTYKANRFEGLRQASEAKQHAREQERIPPSQRLIREDSANTHLYIVHSPDVSLRGVSQIALINDHVYSKTGELYATPFEDTDLAEKLAAFNALLDPKEALARRKLEPRRDVLDKTVDGLISKIPGDTGRVVGLFKDGVELAIKNAEKKRRQALEQAYPGMVVSKVRINQPVGAQPFAYTIKGRKNRIHVDLSKMQGEETKVHLVAPQISFRREIPGTAELTSFRDLAYEITLRKKKVSPGKKLAQR